MKYDCTINEDRLKTLDGHPDLESDLASLRVNCSSLTSIEGLASLTSLTSLSLTGCSSLTSIEGLAQLTSLTSLDLYDCTSLTSIEGLASLTSLTSLVLADCSSLTNIETIGTLTELRRLNCNALLSEEDLSEGSWLTGMVGLQELSMNGCEALTHIDGLASLKDLTAVCLAGCKALENVNGLAGLKGLRRLEMLDENGETTDPDDRYGLDGCEALTDLSGLAGLTRLKRLSLDGCASIENLGALSKLVELVHLRCNGCTALTNLDGLAGLTELGNLELGGCDSLSDITPIALHDFDRWSLTLPDNKVATIDAEGLVSLTDHAQVSPNMKVHYLPWDLSLPYCTIDAKGLKTLGGHPDLKPDLTSLKIENGDSLETLDGFENLTELRSLELDVHPYAQNVDGLANCAQLTSLDLRRCYRLQNVDVLANCTQLTSLNLYLCRSLQNVGGLANCTQLTSLDLSDCSALQNVEGLANCTQLTSLRLGGGNSLLGIDVSTLTSLTDLKLNGCTSLASISGIEHLPDLSTLDLSGCPPLPNSTLDSVADDCSVVGWLDPPPLTCSGCGGDSFSGHYDGWYERVQWATEHGARPIRSNPGECEKSARTAFSSLVKDLNADPEWFEPDGEENTSVDVEAEASCVSCGEAIELPSDWFPSSSQARGVPDDVWRSWTLTGLFDSSTGPVLHMRSGWLARSPDSAEGTEPDGGMPCPCCSTGRVEIFGESVFLSSEGGREGGRIKFERASTDDSRWTWESRLERLDARSRADGTQKIPAKIGFRSGVGCSNDGCWEVRGLNRYADVPAAILAAGALEAAGRSLADQELPDLAALAADLEADGAKQTKLLKGALKWIGRADGSKNEEFSGSPGDPSHSALLGLQRIAAELLDFAKA